MFLDIQMIESLTNFVGRVPAGNLLNSGNLSDFILVLQTPFRWAEAFYAPGDSLLCCCILIDDVLF